MSSRQVVLVWSLDSQSRRKKIMRKFRWSQFALWSVCVSASLSGCNCEDDTQDDPWALTDPWPEDMALPAPDLLVIEDMPVAPDMPPDSAPDLPPDMAPIVIPPDIPWEREVVEVVERTQALNDRTSLDVGDDGTVWLGYHSCDDSSCSNPYLSVAINRQDSSSWQREKITPQQGTFGLIVYENEPWVAYLDEINGQFRVGRRNRPGTGEGAWTRTPLPVNFTGAYDGLDLTHDDERIYVTFASSLQTPVDLFARDMTRPNANFIEVAKLDVKEASAALERGLAADESGNLFLVHRDGPNGPYGVARYKLGDNLWDRQSYYDSPSITVSSMLARKDGDICMSNTVDGGFIGDGTFEVTCGKLNNLRRQVWRYDDETVSSYTSMIEGKDGSLIIAYNAGGNSRLRVARRYPDGQWDFRTVFSGSSYGVSTAIDNDNRLVISYYTCDDRCTLEVLSQPY
jgi:hypothetical protein